jgi:hypothetical protein
MVSFDGGSGKEGDVGDRVRSGHIVITTAIGSLFFKKKGGNSSVG